jgi:predicted HicB family RNase H-like nuclease
MSKFKIGPGTGSALIPAAKPPTSIEEFAAGATLVQSQIGPRPAKPVRLNVDLDPETHRRLKMRAVESGVSIAELVRALIARELG